MRQNKKVVGITGGSGAGKSHLCVELIKRGFDVIDTDKVARQVMQKGEECLSETVREFGEEILENGALDRKKLAGIVFQDKDKLEKLNKISHKYILNRVEDMIRDAKSDTVFVEGAVLMESGFECDFMLGVIADFDVRKARIMKRDSLTETEAQNRLSSQKNDSFYQENCDLVIYNNDGGFCVDDILKRIGL